MKKFARALMPKKSGKDNTSELRRRMSQLVGMGLVRQQK